MTDALSRATVSPLLTDNYQYILRGVTYPLPKNLRGANASHEMRVGYLKMLKLTEKGFFMAFSPKEREALLKERMEKLISQLEGDPVIDRIFLVAMAGFVYVCFIGFKNVIARF